MSPLATIIEDEAPRRATAEEIFSINAARETALSRLLKLYISTGLFFMLLPGTLYRNLGSDPGVRPGMRPLPGKRAATTVFV